MPKEQVELDSLASIKLALKTGPLFCDITSPAAKHIPVRNVRAFRHEGFDVNNSMPQGEFTSRYAHGLRVGYEVLVLEGWHVPERVYVER